MKATHLELGLARDGRVSLVLRCPTLDEARAAYDELSAQMKTGVISFKFDGTLIYKKTEPANPDRSRRIWPWWRNR